MLVSHIICGTLAFLIGAFIVYKTLKSRYSHKHNGYLFVLCAFVASVTGAVLSVGEAYQFLVYTSILAVYQLILGIGYVKYKNAFVLYAFYFSLAILPIALLLILTTTVATVVIGVVYLLIILFQVYLYICGMSKMEWLSQHISMMIGVFIIMATALLLRLNVDNNLNPLLWVLPTVLLFPIIYKLKTRYAPRQKGLL